MKILQLSPYFFPEQISSSHLTEDLENTMVRSGIDLEIYCPVPTRGISKEVYLSYRKRKEEELKDGHIRVHRFSMFREGKNPIVRALRYLLVNVIQYHKGIRTEGIDAVFAGSTPPTQGVLCGKVAAKLSKKYGHKVPFVYNLQDVFPDSLVNAGFCRNGSLLWKIGRQIENYTYRAADTIICISQDIKRNILEKGVPESKILVIPNWIDTKTVKPVSREENKLFEELGLDRDKFYITYAGNIGTAQGIDTIIDAAESLKTSGITFVVFGKGSKLEEVKKRTENMKNVKLFPLMPADRVSEVYSLGDLSVVACKKGVGTGAIPSKSFSIMATGTPVLLSFDKGTDLWNLVNMNDCGYASEADDVEGLVKNIMDAVENRNQLQIKGMNGLRLIQEQYSMETMTAKYVSAIIQAVEGIQ